MAKAHSTPTCMRSINRIIHWPVINESLDVANFFYIKIRDSNSVFRYTFTKTENTVQCVAEKVVEIGKPMVCQCLQCQVRMVDSVFSKGLDCVEFVFPCIKISPKYVYYNTVYHTRECVKNTADKVETCLQPVTNTLEPVVKKIVNPVLNCMDPILAPIGSLVQCVGDRVDRLFSCGHFYHGDQVFCSICGVAKILPPPQDEDDGGNNQ